jgi:two-component system, OmpR family, alkaline phosphatase synthesis response regulator PhoP
MMAAPRSRVLVVEDDADMLFVLRHNLEAESLEVVTAVDGQAALKTAHECQPDLILLDVMLPKMDGYRVLRMLRAGGNGVPVLLLTARSSEPEKVYGFRSGADDYVTKPFGLQELLARVDALLRRSARWKGATHAAATVLSFGEVEIDLTNRIVLRRGEEVALSPRAFELLVALHHRRGAIVPRRDLMRDVFGYADGATSRTLDTHIAELRRKLEDDPAIPRHIQTHWRVGYRLVE